MAKLLNKVFGILELVAKTKEALTLSELADLSGLNITTVGRILSNLVSTDYLYRSKTDKKYYLGKKFLEISSFTIFTNNLKNLMVPSLVKLSEAADETASMITWDGIEATRLAVVNRRHVLQVAPEEGAIYDVELHATAQGKAILANMTEEQLHVYYNNHECKAYTPNTIRNLDDLKRNLIIINREGIAISDEELHLGIRGIAAAVRIRDGCIGSLGVIGPSIRLTRARLAELTPIVKSFALEISEELGYKGIITEIAPH